MVFATTYAKDSIMKLLRITILIGAMFVTPIAAFAQQSSAGLTRAQVRADLIQIERAGYNPAMRDNAKYPSDIQAAESRVAAQDKVAQAGSTAVGGSTNYTSESGRRSASAHDSNSLYRHH